MPHHTPCPPTPRSPHVAVIVTVRNEEHTITALLESLIAQTCPPDEVVVVDGGSEDKTVQVLRAYQHRLPLKIRVCPGVNISQGRNIAIRETTAPIIASTDAGVRLSPHWLEHLTAAWRRGENPPAVAGFFSPDPRTPFELALAATTLPLPEEIDPARFLPSSRSVAFTRTTWEAVGGYPEWLRYSEDVVFDLRVRGRVGDFAWAPEAVVFFRPRSSVGAFFRQYRNYAFGDGQADLWRHRHLVRYLTYMVVLPLGVWLGVTVHPGFLFVLLVGGLAYCRRPWWRLWRLNGSWSWREKLLAALWVPLLRLVGDVAKMIGYPQGVWWRWQHRGNVHIHWRRDLTRHVTGSAGGRLL